MIFLWNFFGIPMEFLWYSYGNAMIIFMIFPWDYYGMFEEILWIFYWISLGFLWEFCGMSIGFLWEFYGIFMIVPLISYNMFIRFLWGLICF